METVPTIEPTSFVLEIKEYGKTILTHNDINRERFMNRAKKIIDEHLSSGFGQISSNNQKAEIKNISINLYTY